MLVRVADRISCVCGQQGEITFSPAKFSVWLYSALMISANTMLGCVWAGVSITQHS